MFKTKLDYLQQWNKVEKEGNTNYYKEFPTKNHGNIFLVYNNKTITAFQKDNRLIDEQMVRQYRKEIQKINVCGKKENGLPIFWEDAYHIFSSENFIELKKIVEG